MSAQRKLRNAYCSTLSALPKLLERDGTRTEANFCDSSFEFFLTVFCSEERTLSLKLCKDDKSHSRKKTTIMFIAPLFAWCLAGSCCSQDQGE